MMRQIKKLIPNFLLDFYHYSIAFLGGLFYNFPSRKIKVIGITGTKGKSTTTVLTGKILEKAGFKVAWITSLSLKINKKEWLNHYHLTMPGRFFIQSFLKKALKGGCQYALIEVTSEGIKQHRHRFIDFSIAVFTNLAPEHIESHRGFENYKEAKGQLFEKTNKIHILNYDDKYVDYFLRFNANEKWLYSLKSNNYNQKKSISTGILNKDDNIKRIMANKLVLTDTYSSFEVGGVMFKTKLLGEFNIYNSLAAVCASLSQGVSLSICKEVLENVETIEGRLEKIKEIKDFNVFVDFAHTPDSFNAVFGLMKKITKGRIISVFGAAGGGRDKWKRPVMGQIAAHHSNIIILTNEDPYYDNPMEILNQIEEGIKKERQIAPLKKIDLYKILDRREAIKKALFLANREDTVLVLGKGAEQSIIINDKKIPWDDRKVVREEYEKIRNSRA